MSSAEEATRRFVELGSAAAAAWDRSALAAAEAAYASTSRVAEAMASVMQAAASIGSAATALGEALEAPAKQCQEMLGQAHAVANLRREEFDAALGSMMAARDYAPGQTTELLGQAVAAWVKVQGTTSWSTTTSFAAFERAQTELSQIQKALANLGAADSLSESDEKWARLIAEHTAAVRRCSQTAWHRATALPITASAEAFSEFYPIGEIASPYWEALPLQSRIARLKQVQRRAAWLLLASAIGQIRETVRRRLRLRRTSDRLPVGIVTLQIAYFLNHGCHPPSLQRSCETFRDATRTC